MIIGAERSKKIIELLKRSNLPLSGESIGKITGVSRQVIVQDIALLRAEGYSIMATARGYLLNKPDQSMRLFKVFHTNEQIEDELTTIVDLGGYVDDVMINHRVYGKISAKLDINDRRDIVVFLNNLRTGKSSELSQVTSGYHFHHVYAKNEKLLDEIEAALREKHYLAEFLYYEQF